jgi:hypothetical protein
VRNWRWSGPRGGVDAWGRKISLWVQSSAITRLPSLWSSHYVVPNLRLSRLRLWRLESCGIWRRVIVFEPDETSGNFCWITWRLVPHSAIPYSHRTHWAASATLLTLVFLLCLCPRFTRPLSLVHFTHVHGSGVAPSVQFLSHGLENGGSNSSQDKNISKNSRKYRQMRHTEVLNFYS